MSRSRRTDFILWRSSDFLLDLMVIFTGKKFFGKCTGGSRVFLSRAVAHIREDTPHGTTHYCRDTPRDFTCTPACGTLCVYQILCHHSKFQSCLRIDHNLAHITRDRVQCGTLYNVVALDTTQTLLRCLVFSSVWFWFPYFHNKVLI